MNQASSQTMVRPVEPIAFRSMEVFAHRSLLMPMRDETLDAAPQIDTVDHAAEVRAAYERGRSDGAVESDRASEMKLQHERDAVQRTLKEFQEEKQRYFNAVEGEVVKLSLAIAERVLQREAEMDPLLLAGVARVALSQIADADEAVLHVAAGDLKRWTETLKPVPKGLVFEGNEAMNSSEAVLKTSSGTVDLGLRKQLGEIERGFFEVLGRKPSMVV